MNKITVGISILPTESANIWNNGLNQNIGFLAMLLARIPFVERVYLLNGGEIDHLPAGIDFKSVDAPLVRPLDVTHEIDLVIEMGATLQPEWLRHVRALGARVVTLFAGNTYAAQIELPVFNRSGGAAFMATPWNEIWTLPHHMKTSAPMLRTMSRVPVLEVPYIWSPVFLDQQIARLLRDGHVFGFNARNRAPEVAGWRMAIFEPNVSVLKSCFIPMLVCDAAYRMQPDSVSMMMVMNSFHMKEHATFNRFAAHLDLTRDGKASYEPRLGFADCMTMQRMDAVVAHQWECGLNNAYYDALYGGYPLIHNSEFLQVDGLGFYYPHFDAVRGGQSLLEAWSAEPEYWDDYRRGAADHLHRLAPDDPENIRAYSQRISALMGASLEDA